MFTNLGDMIRHCILVFWLALVCNDAYCQEIPDKAANEYEIKLDLSFKDKPDTPTNTIDFSDEKRRPNGPVAFLAINFKLLLSNDEVKLKVVQNFKTKLFKVKVGEERKIEMGFIDDLKAEEQPQLLLYLLTDQKQEVSKIILSIEKDGTFLINGQRRGKF